MGGRWWRVRIAPPRPSHQVVAPPGFEYVDAASGETRILKMPGSVTVNSSVRYRPKSDSTIFIERLLRVDTSHKTVGHGRNDRGVCGQKKGTPKVTFFHSEVAVSRGRSQAGTSGSSSCRRCYCHNASRRPSFHPRR